MLAGPLDRDPDFVEQLQTRITRLGYGHRVRLAGVLTGAALSHAYTTADLLAAPSARRPTAWPLPKHSPMAYPSLPPPSVGCPKRSAAPPMAPVPANWSLLAIRLPLPPRSETGWVTSATDTGYGPPPDSGGQPCAAGNRPHRR